MFTKKQMNTKKIFVKREIRTKIGSSRYGNALDFYKKTKNFTEKNLVFCKVLKTDETNKTKNGSYLFLLFYLFFL
jgi:hypothetical protein